MDSLFYLDTLSTDNGASHEVDKGLQDAPASWQLCHFEVAVDKIFCKKHKLLLLINVKTDAVSRQAQGLWSGSGSGLTYVVTSLLIGP